MKIIGLTGNIACGKSTAASIFTDLGATVIDADKIAREIVGKGKPALQKIAEQFGSEVLNTDGTLNRDILGSMVFGNDQKRQKLNDITHPEILKEINDLINKYRIEGKKIVIIEAALIVEREKLKEMIDKLIVVSASEDIQIERLEKRNGLTREQALMRINSQIPIEEKIKQADYVINNDSDLNNINTQVKIIWEDLNLPAD
ncbi:MAG: dephospho-CoA kinase [Candidatus Dadabacteria bacterium]|nr:dephospho-CoA kinase [Candidatus Dadabacteria bacterium]NIS07550.1 dephospho-CoA kinase [Candidatus Dadabacteria bacterium]NIY21165.1 dephospho-CoA kinase [Candidatus Dadabacteria bacterium]